MDRRETGRRPAHSAAIRVMHWIGVYAMGCMIFSGWEIYNASPSLPFREAEPSTPTQLRTIQRSN
jgi:thiosulfate reductase cytochrome b subunit